MKNKVRVIRVFFRFLDVFGYTFLIPLRDRCEVIPILVLSIVIMIIDPLR